MGQHPRVEETIGKIPEDKGPDIPAAHKRAKTVTTTRRKLNATYQKSALDTAEYYNKKVRLRTYAIGDKVWLLEKNLMTILSCKKLDRKFHEPF